jgi:hypothetical protein
MPEDIAKLMDLVSHLLPTATNAFLDNLLQLLLSMPESRFVPDDLHALSLRSF